MATEMLIAPPAKRQAKIFFISSWLAVWTSAIGVFFSSFRFGAGMFGTGYQDDFFYYAQIGRNLAFHGISSFDGVHATNGYHPLWLLVVTVVSRVFDVGGLAHAATIYPFWGAMAVVQTVLMLLIALFTLRLCEYYYSNVVLCCCMQLLCSGVALTMLRTGMEVGLTWVLALGLMCFRLRPGFKWSAWNCVIYGLIASFMVLSRLDSVLLVGLIFVFDFAVGERTLAVRIGNALLFLAGMVPLIAYLISNEVWFHILTPVSGQAKQLRFHHFPSSVALASIFGHALERDVLWLAPSIAVTLLAIGQFARSAGKDLRPGHRPVLLATLLFPLTQLAALSVLSDWRLWIWYFYPWLLSAIAAVLVFHGGIGDILSRFETRLQAVCLGLFVAALLSYSVLICLAASPTHNDMYLAALELHDFAKEHPGIYAMGDRAGVVGYLLDQPVFQLEGLTMDKAFLNNIKEQRELTDVLREYHVRYYISTRAILGADGCYSVKEPWQAGPDSPAMHGRICRSPIATIQHHLYVNHVFDMQQP